MAITWKKFRERLMSDPEIEIDLEEFVDDDEIEVVDEAIGEYIEPAEGQDDEATE